MKWELDTDEIRSVASDDLHDQRPNRWTGPKSTWRELTQDDRLLWQSMKHLRDQDLAVHLYNSFALKQRGKDERLAQDLTIKTVRLSDLPSLLAISTFQDTLRLRK